MIKIGIEATTLCTPNKSGIAQYAASLLEALSDDKEFKENYEIELLYKLSRFKKRKYCYNTSKYPPKWHFKGLLPLIKNYQIVHSLDNIFLDFRKVKKIVSVYDLAIFKEENNFEGYTDEAFKNKTYSFLKNVTKKADAIIAISESTKKDLLHYFNFPEEKVFVTHLGVRLPKIFESNSGILEKHSLETKKYFLFAGMISIRKNLLNLIKAYKESGMHKEYKLVLSGGASMGYDTIIAEVKKAGLEKNVLFPGFVSDNELSDLFINAKAFLFPTFYEGFGMPIIEAMHYNVPVLIGDRGAAPEVADNHAILSNPFDVDSIADGIKKVATMNDLSISNAANHAAKFTWEKCAKETMAVYNKIR